MKETSNSAEIKGIHYETGKPVKIVIADGLIDSIVEIEYDSTGIKLYIAPGLIDNQINGYSGVDFSGLQLSSKDISLVARSLKHEGITTFFPTLLTNSHKNLIKNFRILNDALSEDESLQESNPGFHLEGPYISPDEGYRGCHPHNHIRKPSWSEFMTYQEAAGGKIKQVTLAPEIEGAIEFIKLCVANDIVAAIGHTNATADQISAAVDAGARLSTHLGNGCANYIHRHNNPIWPQLANDRLIPSIIADGFHLLPEEIKVFYKTKGQDNIILTSDVMYLAGKAPGKYIFMEEEVILTDEGMLINPRLNCLAGASFSLKKGVENMMNFTGCSLANAINMASKNVAAIYGLTDRGELIPCKSADLILFEKNGNILNIKKTYQNGSIVYSD
jgi:N-acetylglucosamine-6-phosphate deacetylase